MALRMASPWKHPKTGMFWFRRRVPDNLLARVGRTIFQRSLRTKDVTEAKRLYLQIAAQIDREWTDMRGIMEHPHVEVGY